MMGHLGTLEHGWDHLAAPECMPTNSDVFLAVVLCQRGLSAEALAAPVDRALVRSLASVNSSVASQGTAIAEPLLAIRLFTHVWTLTRVCSLMDSQGRALDE